MSCSTSLPKFHKRGNIWLKICILQYKLFIISTYRLLLNTFPWQKSAFDTSIFAKWYKKLQKCLLISLGYFWQFHRYICWYILGGLQLVTVIIKTRLDLKVLKPGQFKGHFWNFKGILHLEMVFKMSVFEKNQWKYDVMKKHPKYSACEPPGS